MKTFFLTVVFIMSNGDLTLLDGYYPREQPSMEICQERKNALFTYLMEYPVSEEHKEVVGFAVACLPERIDAAQ
jgi:hypothetical protein